MYLPAIVLNYIGALTFLFLEIFYGTINQYIREQERQHVVNAASSLGRIIIILYEVH